MRTLLFLSTLLLSEVAFGQIKMAGASDPTPVNNEVNAHYDSTVDDVLKNYDLLHHQDIFIIDNGDEFNGSYTDFYTHMSCQREYQYHAEQSRYRRHKSAIL